MNDTPARFRVLVTGSRTWIDTTAITTALDELHAVHGPRLVVVHGACPTGADAIAHTWAHTHGVPVETHPADWSTGRSAGPARNAAMVATNPDTCLAFIRDHSTGATGCADLAEHAGIPTTRTTTSTTTDSIPTADTATSSGTETGTAASTPVATSDGLDLTGRAEADAERLVAVVDGPMAGQWFTLTDWRARIAAARYIAEATSARTAVLDYAPGPIPVPHPQWAGVTGIAATHAPSRAATAARSSSRVAVAVDDDADVA
ncbi:MAG: DUF2493 domain-containing protein [Actinomycetales bacterium]|nr:DUF2493 domain-containing protein [Actinomycetales bacterium]